MEICEAHWSFQHVILKGLGSILKAIDDSMDLIRFRKSDKGNLIDLNFILRNIKPFQTNFKRITCSKNGVILFTETQK